MSDNSILVVLDSKIPKTKGEGLRLSCVNRFIEQKRDYRPKHCSVNPNPKSNTQLVVLSKPIQTKPPSLNMSINTSENQWGILSSINLSSQCDPNNNKALEFNFSRSIVKDSKQSNPRSISASFIQNITT